MAEGQLVRAILDALKLKGVWAWRNQSAAVVLGSGANRRFLRQGEAGGPDIMGIRHDGGWGDCPRGHLFGLEVKTAKGKQSASQRAWQAKAEAHGVRYAVVRGVGEALKAVESWV